MYYSIIQFPHLLPTISFLNFKISQIQLTIKFIFYAFVVLRITKHNMSIFVQTS
jgi:hypothetical protein